MFIFHEKMAWLFTLYKIFNSPPFPQIKAVDNGRPQKSSTCRLHIEWIPKPQLPADAAPLVFEESPFTFSVMESDPVAHMVGVVATESSDVSVWFEITGNSSLTFTSVVCRMLNNSFYD